MSDLPDLPRFTVSAHCDVCRTPFVDLDELRYREDGKWCCSTCCENPVYTIAYEIDVQIQDESQAGLADFGGAPADD